nr:MAG TPA: hypothetical protein [Caudoviricetes sp.]
MKCCLILWDFLRKTTTDIYIYNEINIFLCKNAKTY